MYGETQYSSTGNEGSLYRMRPTAMMMMYTAGTNNRMIVSSATLVMSDNPFLSLLVCYDQYMEFN